jgi:hypothetical protein
MLMWLWLQQAQLLCGCYASALRIMAYCPCLHCCAIACIHLYCTLDHQCNSSYYACACAAAGDIALRAQHHLLQALPRVLRHPQQSHPLLG